MNFFESETDRVLLSRCWILPRELRFARPDRSTGLAEVREAEASPEGPAASPESTGTGAEATGEAGLEPR